MNVDEIKTALALAWRELEAAADTHDEHLSERDQEMWELGFMAGGKALTDHLVKKFKLEKVG